MPNHFFDTFVEELEVRFQTPLPGEKAHARMLAQSDIRRMIKPNERTRKSAVLILFYPHREEIFLPLILRPAYDGVHSGQMAFPGGRFELSDEDLIRTAKREAQEEIGLRLTDVRIVGQLSELFIPPSNFFVLPVVAYIPYRPEFYPDPREVEKVLEVPLNEVRDKTIIGTSELVVRGIPIQAPHYLIQNHKVWGATAMMISELLTILED
ncbi:NUDIX hydrolase [Arundinibacter roseus]|uniref:CoA pyrophosphatase n=1 Tax=Arundinibacter roseus TaxID=2070510 RepID=A0A4R4K9H9_9BACT|nr:CoA pyrophosphatase [Arundinibacter roseus]TDB64457.1 CoA pyrophosphatase [Arundinibacter roseus]